LAAGGGMVWGKRRYRGWLRSWTTSLKSSFENVEWGHYTCKGMGADKWRKEGKRQQAEI
jgi:hypothetical protein